MFHCVVVTLQIVSANESSVEKKKKKNRPLQVALQSSPVKCS